MKASFSLRTAASCATDRFELWANVVSDLRLASVAEFGVYRGDFAQHMLRSCCSIDQYFMVDPWRHLDDWNKPANREDSEFCSIKKEALAKTDFAAHKRSVLQGRTTEVSDRLPNESIEFAYIDGDHTLRGIMIDLIRVWPKIKHGGILAGDDFCRSVRQHDSKFEPTLVFPAAIHFAEAVGAQVFGLPFDQFAIVVDRSESSSFEFLDLTGHYDSTSLRDALMPENSTAQTGLGRQLLQAAWQNLKSRRAA